MIFDECAASSVQGRLNQDEAKLFFDLVLNLEPDVRRMDLLVYE
jgi:hypothetical protein